VLQFSLNDEGQLKSKIWQAAKISSIQISSNYARRFLAWRTECKWNQDFPYFIVESKNTWKQNFNYVLGFGTRKNERERKHLLVRNHGTKKRFLWKGNADWNNRRKDYFEPMDVYGIKCLNFYILYKDRHLS
jgi:hypothetical protein